MLTKSEKQLFLRQLSISNSINLPAIADMHGMCWETGVKPAIEKDDKFKVAIQNYLEKCKYSLLQKIYSVATDGVLDGTKRPDLSFIKEICRLIDNGVITGTSMKDEPAPPPELPQVDAAAEKELQAQSEAAAFIAGLLPKS